MEKKEIKNLMQKVYNKADGATGGGALKRFPIAEIIFHRGGSAS